MSDPGEVQRHLQGIPDGRVVKLTLGDGTEVEGAVDRIEGSKLTLTSKDSAAPTSIDLADVESVRVPFSTSGPE